MADDDDHVNDGALVVKLSQVLLSAECQRLNFRWGRQHITGHGFRTVVLALLDTRIDLFEADAKHKLDDDVEASYDGWNETMIIRPRLDLHRLSNRGTIVHEATHAIQDVQLAGKWTWSLDEEATAYIAEWLYVIHSSKNPHHLRNNPAKDEPIDTIAFEIARALQTRLARLPTRRRCGDWGTRSTPVQPIGSRWRCTLGLVTTASRPQTFRRGHWAGDRATPGRACPTRPERPPLQIRSVALLDRRGRSFLCYLHDGWVLGLDGNAEARCDPGRRCGWVQPSGRG